VVSFKPRPLYPRGKSPWYPLDRRLGEPQNHYTLKKVLMYDTHVKNKKILAYIHASISSLKLALFPKRNFIA
jgi:hypothetical protein